MEPRRWVEGAALALADAESAALEAPAQRSPQRWPARAPRLVGRRRALALGDVDHAATYSSDDEARPAPTEEPAYADDDAAFGSVMDAFAEPRGGAGASGVRRGGGAGGAGGRGRGTGPRRPRRGGCACRRGGRRRALGGRRRAGEGAGRGQGPRGGGRRRPRRARAGGG